MPEDGAYFPLPLRVQAEAGRKFFGGKALRRSVREHLERAKQLALEYGPQYCLDLWQEVPVMDGTHGQYASFPGIVTAAVNLRNVALQPMMVQLHNVGEREALEALTCWYLDCMFFRFCFERVQVALLFGRDPVSVSDDVADRVAVTSAQFLFRLTETSPEDLIITASLTIRERLWSGPPPAEWLGLW